jgi:hypothetical protein
MADDLTEHVGFEHLAEKRASEKVIGRPRSEEIAAQPGVQEVELGGLDDPFAGPDPSGSLMTSRRVLLIGCDAADWNVISPLIDAGKMSHLSKLGEAGIVGDMSTLVPPLSPLLWTSIATGRRPCEHGVVGFFERDPDGRGVRPFRVTRRKVKALWTIATSRAAGPPDRLVAEHPAEPIAGGGGLRA